MHVAIIGGAGTVGASVGYSLATTLQEVDVTLIDIDYDAACGHGIDLRHARAHVAHPLGRAYPNGTGELGGIRAAGPDDRVAQPDVFVVTASAPRPNIEPERGSRSAFLEANLAVADNVADQLRRFDPAPVIVVTNPVDRIAYRIWQATGWSRSRVIGYSMSETARAADALASIRDSPPSDVTCPVMGEHGENVVPVFSHATIRGAEATLDAHERAEIREYIRNVPFEVIALRGEADTSRWVTGWGVSLVVRALLHGGVDEAVCLSVPLDGEYGFEDVCLGVPLTLSIDGVAEILEWELSDQEHQWLSAAYESVQA